MIITPDLPEEHRIQRWYFGGLSAGCAVVVTHPLDLIKVHMQVKKDKSAGMMSLAREVITENGIRGLYSGLSASLLRQLTYSTTRFGVYEYGKTYMCAHRSITFLESLGLAAVAGVAGAIIGNPPDLINVRMQNDIKLPVQERRKNAFHGLYVAVSKEEGLMSLWTGLPVNALRAAFMTAGQLTFYSQFKELLLSTIYFEDNMYTHITCSIAAGVVATTLTLPIDVLKTRAMNARVGEPRNISALILCTAKEGPTAFFKGFAPSLLRTIPQTVLTFVILEQFTKHFGKIEVLEP